MRAMGKRTTDLWWFIYIYYHHIRDIDFPFQRHSNVCTDYVLTSILNAGSSYWYLCHASGCEFDWCAGYDIAYGNHVRTNTVIDYAKNCKKNCNAKHAAIQAGEDAAHLPYSVSAAASMGVVPMVIQTRRCGDQWESLFVLVLSSQCSLFSQ